MKGTQGLVIAAALGIVGALCNWFYVSRRAEDLKKEEFIYVKAGRHTGDVFKEEHFGKVEIPKAYVGDLRRIAVPWSERRTVVGYPAIRDYPTDQLLLREDTLTPPKKPLSRELGPDEESQAVLVNPSTFVPENFNPGEYVTFAAPATVRIGGQPKSGTEEELAGPFRILRIGSRAGSSDVYRARGLRSSRSNVIVVPLVFKRDKNTPNKKRYDEKSRRLLKLLELAGGQGLEVRVQSAQNTDHGAGP